MNKWFTLTKLFVLVCILVPYDVAHSVSIFLSVEGNSGETSVGYTDNVWNPLIDKGLRTTADRHHSASGFSTTFGPWAETGDAAVYGSDFSVSSGPGSITPYGVEPMAFVQASAQGSGSTGADARIEVDHRVIVNPVNQSLPQEVLNILNALNAVNVTLKARGEANRDNIGNTFFLGYGIEGGQTNPINLLEIANSSIVSSLNYQVERELKFTVEPSDVQQNILYTIWAEAAIGVSGRLPTGEVPNPPPVEGQAVVDPFFEIDPDWIISDLVGTVYDPHGANYFLVQQESLMNEGQWIEVSREWTVVPLPASVWLFGSGLLGLIGIARRKKA